MANNPGCAVGMFDRARNVSDARGLLASAGISLDGHAALQGGAIVELVATADAWLVTDVGMEARLEGTAVRAVRLRDGKPAQLHLVEIRDGEGTTVILIVPSAGDAVAPTPAPTPIIASPRVGTAQCNGFGEILSASPSMLALLGRLHPLDGEPIISHLHPDDRDAGIVMWVAAKGQRGVALRWRCRVVRADESNLWVEVTLTNSIDGDGHGEVQLDMFDISAEVAATDALAAETELLALLTETLPVGVAKFDTSGRVEQANTRLTELLAPRRPSEVLGLAALGALESPDLAAAFTALFRDGTGSKLVIHDADVNGETRHLEWTIRPVLADDGEVSGGVVCVADVTEASLLRQTLEQRAMTDALTGCLNRAGTLAALDAALATIAPGDGVGLLFIDLDSFKHINDARGHAIGDVVLEVVASRLHGALRAQDLLGRLGGDEFVVIAPRIGSEEAMLVLAGRMSQKLQGPATIGDITVAISASIGVAWTSAGEAIDLLAAADASMYAAKQARAGRKAS
ncbi:MAG: diguanylate cyclase [Actinomycetota bacterium]|jgi:diguanylate cyclase (GGDEF)-like protein/PAS domain S-box-containing protein|nr:diguanylate cyclase [Actinomycetota bacterium]